MTMTTTGPEALRPAQAECPNCGCCSAVLCERGRHRTTGCTYPLVEAAYADLVADCPCSAPTTRGTAAWRLDQVRIVRHAIDRPMTAASEDVLRALLDDDAVNAPGFVVTALRAWEYIAVDDGMLSITDRGRRYLTARDEPRFAAQLVVDTIDRATRTARVVLDDWRGGPVTVLLDQLTGETDLPPSQLSGRVLRGMANITAATADDVVLTQIRVAEPLPEAWTAGHAVSVPATVGGAA